MDGFKYRNFNNDPTPDGEIKIGRKKDFYSVKFDIATDLSDSFLNFSKAYYLSADIIANRMLNEHQIDELDRYFFPLFFLYRHSIELILKSIGCIFITDKTDRISFLNDTFHNLEVIYQYLLERTSKVRPDDESIWIQNYFHSISKFDRESDSFRYPFHIKKKNDGFGNIVYLLHRVFQKQTHIDLIGEINKMIAAYEILMNWYLDFEDDKSVHVSSEYKLCTTSFLDEGGYYYEQSVVGYEYHYNDFYAYLSGYKECANYLKQYMVQEYDNGNNTIGYMVYPMCYLYRNDIELLLKAIIIDFSDQSLQGKCAAVYENKHSIPKLFANVEKHALPIYEIAKEAPYVKNAKRYCELLHKFDLDSSKFRYPVNKQCDPYYQMVRYFDFVQLGVFLESLCNAVDGIHGEIEYRKDAIDTMAAEYNGYI